MKFKISLVLSLFLSLTVSLLGGVSAQAAQKTLVCELKDLNLGVVLDRGSDTLDNPHVLFFVGTGDVQGMVRDVSQPANGERNLQLQLNYRSGVESGQSHAETTYIAESAPLQTTLAETSLELGPTEHRYQLRCFLQ